MAQTRKAKINQIEIRDLRNISHLVYRPSAQVNLIVGFQGCGKTTLFDAMVLTDATDTEFFAILRKPFQELGYPVDFSEVIEQTFFRHQEGLESFKVQMDMSTGRPRQFGISRTDESSLIAADLDPKSPFIFVYDSAAPDKLLAYCIPYDKVKVRYDAHFKFINHWPLHYFIVGSIRTHTVWARMFHSLIGRKSFQTSMRDLCSFLPYLDIISLQLSASGPEIMVKTTDRYKAVPLYGCSPSLIRLITATIAIHYTEMAYFVVDEIDFRLTARELSWLIFELLQTANRKKIQLFMSTTKPVVVQAVVKSIDQLKISDINVASFDDLLVSSKNIKELA